MSVVEQQAENAALYGIERWGDGYFRIAANGRLLVTPDGESGGAIDLRDLVDQLEQRGLQLPVLIRFNGILSDRLRRLNECFEQAIAEYGYRGTYRCVFPIKVNQQRDVVEKLIEQGRSFGFGVEAGSKPELLALVAMTDAQTPIICNGFKDREFIRIALMASQLGRTVIPVVEKASELDLILEQSGRLETRPTIGIRVKLATRGSGRWQASGGYRSKFGLTVAEILTQFERLKQLGMADCIQMLHFHLGSQITDIRRLKSALLEASRVYVDLHKRGAGLTTLDVGGGLGIDYEGSASDRESSVNYSIQEYANDVVYLVQTVCEEAGVPHPTLITESGRALTAHHSVLVVETLGVTAQGNVEAMPRDVTDDCEQPVRDLWMTYQGLSSDNARESFHDAQNSLDLCASLFAGGYLPLEQRVMAENLYFAICHQVRELAQTMEPIPDELRGLDRLLSDIYFANFSLFQSLPDSWAIGHHFPVMPIHRLDERPTRHAVLGDITCDSDGKIEHFTRHGACHPTLMLHDFRADQRYLLGIFLVGAYQEILGDLHNLFGDTHAVHVELQGDTVAIQSVIKGDTVTEVLGYLQYDERELVRRFLDSVEQAVHQGRITNRQAGDAIRFYEQALAGYTYLSRES